MGTSKAAFRLQDRDFFLLRGLFESRLMTAAHVAVLYFDSKPEAAKKRLQKLKTAGLIGERPRKAYEPAVLHLTRAGLLLLKEHGVLAEYPALSLPALERRARVSSATVRHELDVMDVKVAVHAAFRGDRRFTVVEFGTWPRLHEFQATPNGGLEVLVRPDGFIRIHEKEAGHGLSEHTFFLEVDRSTEAQDILVSRAAAYLDYYKSGGLAVKNGAPRSAFKEFPFRVLMILKTVERRNNTAERLLQNYPPILTQTYLTTMDEVRADPLAAIWIRPIDYRVAVSGTAFDAENAVRSHGYLRQAAREVIVEQNIRKQRMLEN